MRIGFGWLRLSPQCFWAMTLNELITGADGFAMTLGAEVDRPPYISRKEFEEWERILREKGEIFD